MDLSDLRYDRPRLFYSGAAGLAALLLIAGFAALPATPFFKTIGVTAIQQRAGAAQRATYWFSRSIVHASAAGIIPVVRYGNVVGIDQDGRIIVSLPDGDQYAHVRFELADVLVTDLGRAAMMIDAIRLDDAKFEIYDGNKAVVWLHREPFNVALIEAGAASPDPDPPTNIVDRAFASHYWSIVKRGK